MNQALSSLYKMILGFIVSICFLAVLLSIVEISSYYYLSTNTGKAFLLSGSNDMPRAVPVISGQSLFVDTDFQKQVSRGYQWKTVIPSTTNQKSFLQNEFGFRAYKKNYKEVVQASTSDGQVLYQAHYSFDAQGRRSTPRNSQKQPREHVLFFGCSFVFGEGLNDNQTLPAYYQELAPQSVVYNLAKQGGSIADAIAGLTTHDNWEGVTQQNGRLIISFNLRMHLPRFVGTARTVGTWNQLGSYVKKNDSQGGFQLLGNFFDTNPGWVFASTIISKSSFFKLIGFDWPVLNDESLRQYAQAIEFVATTYRKKQGVENPVIVFFPPGADSSSKIIKFLNDKNIFFLDYSTFDISRYLQGPPEIPYNGHPSAEYNKVLAQQIFHDLNLPENKSRFEKSYLIQ